LRVVVDTRPLLNRLKIKVFCGEKPLPLPLGGSPILPGGERVGMRGRIFAHAVPTLARLGLTTLEIGPERGGETRFARRRHALARASSLWLWFRLVAHAGKVVAEDRHVKRR